MRVDERHGERDIQEVAAAWATASAVPTPGLCETQARSDKALYVNQTGVCLSLLLGWQEGRLYHRFPYRR